MVTAMTTFYFWLSLMLPQGSQDARHLDPSIVSVSDAYLSGVLAGDAAAVAATYREDAVEMPFCRPVLAGRVAIERYYGELFRSPVKITSFTFSRWEAAVSGDIGYETGTYKQTMARGSAGSSEDSGRYVVILKRTGGVWKAAYVIYNSDKAPAR